MPPSTTPAEFCEYLHVLQPAKDPGPFCAKIVIQFVPILNGAPSVAIGTVTTFRLFCALSAVAKSVMLPSSATCVPFTNTFA